MFSAIVWPGTRKEQNIRKSEKADAPNGSEGSKEMHNDKMEEVKKATFCNIQYNQLAPLLPNRTHKRTHTLKHGTVSVRYEVNFEFGPVNQLLSNSIRPTACPATMVPLACPHLRSHFIRQKQTQTTERRLKMDAEWTQFRYLRIVSMRSTWWDIPLYGPFPPMWRCGSIIDCEVVCVIFIFHLFICLWLQRDAWKRNLHFKITTAKHGSKGELY